MGRGDFRKILFTITAFTNMAILHLLSIFAVEIQSFKFPIERIRRTSVAGRFNKPCYCHASNTRRPVQCRRYICPGSPAWHIAVEHKRRICVPIYYPRCDGGEKGPDTSHPLGSYQATCVRDEGKQPRVWAASPHVCAPILRWPKWPGQGACIRSQGIRALSEKIFNR